MHSDLALFFSIGDDRTILILRMWEAFYSVRKSSLRSQVALCIQSGGHRQTDKPQWEDLGHPLSWDLCPAGLVSASVHHPHLATVPGSAICPGRFHREKF